LVREPLDSYLLGALILRFLNYLFLVSYHGSQ
jgi:hypothetical protein